MSGLTDVESLMTVLRDESVDELHSWRCAYPDRYGPCSCVAELADAVLAWHGAIVARAVNEALIEAADEVSRMHRIGQTAIKDVTADEGQDYESHPLGEALSMQFAYDARPSIAAWLRARAT